MHIETNCLTIMEINNLNFQILQKRKIVWRIQGLQEIPGSLTEKVNL